MLLSSKLNDITPQKQCYCKPKAMLFQTNE